MYVPKKTTIKDRLPNVIVNYFDSTLFFINYIVYPDVKKLKP